jgi:hypothetical protein
MFLVLVLGTIDATYMFHDWIVANKAAYMGARTAVTSNPVDPGVIISDKPPPEDVHKSCLVVLNCPSVSTVCTGTTSGVTCTGGDNAAFTRIFNTMQKMLPRLQRSNVTISYQTNGTGLVGQLWDGNSDFANPKYIYAMNVTVSITGMTHQFYFIAPLLRFLGGGINATPAIPTFATTLQSEDMFTN